MPQNNHQLEKDGSKHRWWQVTVPFRSAAFWKAFPCFSTFRLVPWPAGPAVTAADLTAQTHPTPLSSSARVGPSQSRLTVVRASLFSDLGIADSVHLTHIDDAIAGGEE